MDNRYPYASILFSTGRTNQASWRNQQISRIIRICSCSRICHCAIGYDGAILDRTLNGVAYWPLDQGIELYPTLCAVVLVRFKYRINLDWPEFHNGIGVPIRTFPTLFRWLRLGHGPWVDDCLCIVLACLQAGGVDVPRTIATPGGLYRWLKGRNYPHVTDARKNFRRAARRLAGAYP